MQGELTLSWDAPMWEASLSLRFDWVPLLVGCDPVLAVQFSSSPLVWAKLIH